MRVIANKYRYVQDLLRSRSSLRDYCSFLRVFGSVVMNAQGGRVGSYLSFGSVIPRTRKLSIIRH
jgi:hypothetical protein